MLVCPDCGKDIVSGDAIRFAGDKLKHANCQDTVENPIKRMAEL